MEWASKHGLPASAAWGIAFNQARHGMMHPGTKGKHYLQRAWDGGHDALMADLDASIERYLSRLGAFAVD